MKPMLAATADPKKLHELNYPLLASPKLDGVRALVIDGVVMSRSMKPIPNRHVQFLFGDAQFNGLDGELIVGEPTSKTVFRDTMSGVMSEHGKPSVRFYVFDVTTLQAAPFDLRNVTMRERVVLRGPAHVRAVPQKLIENALQLSVFETQMLEAGYEGVMLRHPQGPYKQGRSTVNEGYLLKLKRFADSEAEILGAVELLTNTNERKADGRRSSHKAGRHGAGVLGALQVRDIHSGVEFEIGSGFSADDRAVLWSAAHKLAGRIIKYKFFDNGSKDKPRFPVFLGFRDRIDIGG